MIAPSKDFFISMFGRTRGGSMTYNVKINKEKGEELYQFCKECASNAFNEIKNKYPSLYSNLNKDNMNTYFVKKNRKKLEDFLQKLQYEYIKQSSPEIAEKLYGTTSHHDEWLPNTDIVTQFQCLHVSEKFIRNRRLPAFIGWDYEAMFLL